MSTPRPLLDRQVSLLAHLTSAAAIFDGAASRDAALEGIDRGSLHLVARFSHNKRMQKIAATFPKTFEMLRSEGSKIFVEFARTCPPTGTGRMENARQFHNFLAGRRADKPLEPAHLRDVAALEFACATARIRGGDPALQAEEAGIRLPGWVRRRPAVLILRCEYDLRVVFEDGSERAAPAKRDTALAISFPPSAASPQIFELAPVGYALMAAMDDWIDPTTLGDSPEVKELLRELVRCGLLESSL
jgi:hypothetical protein